MYIALFIILNGHVFECICSALNAKMKSISLVWIHVQQDTYRH